MRISSIDLRQDHDETIFFLHDWVVHTIWVRNSFLIFMYSYPLPQSLRGSVASLLWLDYERELERTPAAPTRDELVRAEAVVAGREGALGVLAVVNKVSGPT